MQSFETPYAADWFAISLRWAAILGLVATLGLGGDLNAATAWPLVLLLLWNMAMTVLASLNARLWQHRYINLTVDALLAAALFWVQGGLRGPASWAGLLPILTASIYFELIGALVVAGIFGLFGFLTSELYFKAHSTLVVLWLLGAFGLGGLFGLLGAQLESRYRSKRQAWLESEEARRRVQGDRLRAIYELTSTLTATLSYKRVLDTALDLSYSALNPDSSDMASVPLVSAVLLFRGGQLRVGSARRFTNADSKVTFDGSEGILKRVFDEGEPIFSTDVSSDPELGRIIALRNCTAAYCFPLRSGFNVYGAMVYGHPDPEYFTPVRRDLLDIIGRQAVIAVQNARLYQDLVEEKDRMIEVHEEARKKLARDLHDGPTQSIAAMAMRLSIARRMLEQDAQSASEELTKIEELAQRTSKEIRHMLFTLRPLILESEGLKAALKAMADKMAETFSQNVIIDVDDEVIRQMEMGKQGVIFYIIEEAVGNARKHASATNIWVRLLPFQPGVVRLEIEDDGIGFDLAMVDQAYDRHSSLGLVNLRERVELVNGVLDIQSIIGKGTRITVYVPLTGDAADRLHIARNTQPRPQLDGRASGRS